MEDNRPAGLSALWTISQSLHQGILVENQERRLIIVNQVFCDLFGIPIAPEQLRGFDCAEAATQAAPLFEDTDGFLERVNEVLANRTIVRGELLKLRDGRVFERDFVPVIERGQYRGHVWTYEDVTSKQRLEQALHDVAAMRGLILNSALDAVVTIDAMGCIVEFNPSAESMFGVTAESVQGRMLEEIIIPERYRDAHREGMRHFRATGEGPVLNRRLELTALRCDGTEFPIELAIVPVPQPTGTLFTAWLRDISERARSQSLLMRQEQLAQAVAEAATILLTCDDLDIGVQGVLASVGHAAGASRVYMFRHHDVADAMGTISQTMEWCNEGVVPQIDNPDLQNMPWETGFERWYHELSAGACISGFIDTLPAYEADFLRAQSIKAIVVVPIFINQEFWGFMGFDDCVGHGWTSTEETSLRTLASNIGVAIQRRRLERALRQSEDKLQKQLAELTAKSTELEVATALIIKQEKLATLGTIAGSVAHEINSPLGAILNSAERLLEQNSDNPETERNLRLIERAALRMRDVIQRLLTSAGQRPSSVESTSTDVVEAMNDCLMLYGTHISTLGITVQHIADTPVRVQIGATELSQVLTNLLVNARDAVMELPDSSERLITAHTSIQDSYGVFTMTNNGPHIAEDVLPTIFDAFVSTKESGKGTGLGLWICKSIASDAGGTLTLENVPQGVRATMRLPLIGRGK